MKKTRRLVLLSSLLIILSAKAHSSEIIYDNSVNQPLFSLLQNSQKSIDVEIYEMKDTRIQKALLDALDRKVRVRIIQESQTFGSKCLIFKKTVKSDDAECMAQKEFLRQVISKGGIYQPYPVALCNSADKNRCLEHGKLILMDGQKAWISTGNLNATNLCDPLGAPDQKLGVCNRDYSVVTEDPNSVGVLIEVFEADLQGTPYDLPKILSQESAKKITVSPYSLDPIVTFIRSAKTSIRIENQYLKHAEMNTALMDAAKRGVEVSVVVSSICAFGQLDAVKDFFAIDVWKKIFTEFDQAGVKSRIFTKSIKIQGFDGYLHSKAIVVDGKNAWVGSVNGSTQAMSKNREFGIFIDDMNEVSKLDQIMATDYQDPNTESWQESLLCKKDLP